MDHSACWRPALVALVALAAWPASALAASETFCVQDAACAGDHTNSSVAGALSAAHANGPELDVIQIGPGTFSSGATLTDAADNPVEIRGAGSSATTLTRSGGGAQFVLYLMNAGSSVSNLDIHLQAGSLGLRLGGAAGDLLRISAVPAVTASTGVLMSGGTLRRSFVGLPLGDNTGVSASFNSLVEANGITARTGVSVSGTGARITGDRITARVGVVLAGGSGFYSASVDNTEVKSLAAEAGDTAIKVTAAPSPGLSTSLTARHLTLIGSGTGTGMRVDATSGQSNADASLDVRDTLVRGYSNDVSADESLNQDASVVVDSSAYDFTKTSIGAGADFTTGPKNLNLNGADPRLRDVSGDMRPGFDSPLVDRGVPGALQPSESTVDLARLPRLIDGDGDGTATRDIGAFEYQRSVPQVTPAAAPASAAPGEQIAFSASATDADPGEVPTIAWTFDDGATASGDSVSHSFATPGTHTATAVATDPAGVTNSATASVTVDVPAAQPGPLDRTAPLLGISKRAVTLSKTRVATVVVTCPAAEASGPCQGTLTLTTDRKVRLTSRAKARKLKLGHASFSVAPGQSGKVKVKLSKASARLVARVKRLPVLGVADVRDQAGNRATAKARFKVNAPKKRARRR